MLLTIELAYIIKDFISDSSTFRLVCKMFAFVMTKNECNHKSIMDNQLRQNWMLTTFGSMRLSGKTMRHRTTKTDFAQILFNDFTGSSPSICAVGRSSKMLKFVLNQMSNQNYIGGAVFGEETRQKIDDLLHQYAPQGCFSDMNQLDKFYSKQCKFGRVYRRFGDEKWRIFAIVTEFQKNHQSLRKLLMNHRHISTDLLLLLGHPILSPEHRGNFDSFVFKKTKNDSPLLLKQFIGNLLYDPQLCETFDKMYQSTYKRNKVLQLKQTFRGFTLTLFDIDDQLADSYLSDNIFWHYLHKSDSFNEKID